jgi:hypothetical protein
MSARPCCRTRGSWLAQSGTTRSNRFERQGNAGALARSLRGGEPMIYRKAPPQPGRLLLRIVAATGGGALLGVVGCASSVDHPSTHVMGSTGSATFSGAGSGYEAMGSSGSASVAGAGTGYEGSGSGTTNGAGVSTGYEASGSTGANVGSGGAADAASSTDASSSEASVAPLDATAPEAGQMILGISVAPPDAGSEQ